ncbi:MAG TPA: hydrogenase maturation protease [Anaeromyxobacteraceae bacterium]|nr:hydrogenase maturation protease [Anaeromyxobacteraceae bacterium]
MPPAPRVWRPVAHVAVVGIGNVLNGDDGVGPYAVRVLEAGWELPAEVEVVDAGTPGGDLASMLDGASAAVIVDAVNAKGAPGELRRYDRAEILRGAPRLAMSPHEPGVREALLTLDFRGGGPGDVTLLGAIPASVEQATALTPAVRAAVPALVEAVVAELRRLGLEPRPRAVPLAPDIWWERPP